ncbi:hypothetical protein L218DRAFT_1065832, partial [Marasmius fiardii PR-910]
LEVTDFKIATEVVSPQAKPSPASGISDNEWTAFCSQQPADAKLLVVWLLEPMRTGTPKKWSGTLQHPSHQGKLGVTLTTFVHFTYEWSQKTIV